MMSEVTPGRLKVQDHFLYIKIVKKMDEKSMRDPEKVKDVEDVTIERSIRMKEGAKTKIQDKLIVLRKGSKVKVNKVKSKRTCTAIFCGISKVHLRKET